MFLNVKDERAHDLAKRIAQHTGQSLTAVVREALAEKLERVEKAQAKNRAALAAELNRLALHCASLLNPADERTADEIIGYDARGLPT